MIRLESQHELPFPPASVWPLLSNTDWLNRSVGLPPVKYDIQARTEGGSNVFAHTKYFGTTLRWQELPFEWVEPEFYCVHRIFEGGPFCEGRMGLELENRGSGTVLTVWSEFAPRNPFGGFLARRLLGPKTERQMRRVVAQVREFLGGRAPIALPSLPVSPVNEAALTAGLASLRQAGLADGLVSRLERFLREAPDVELTHIRPFAIAKKWNQPPWEVLRLFLHAPKCGLLDLRWEVLCPNCRSSMLPQTKSLNQLKSGAHCDVCQIQFDGEFDKSVELKFSVNQGVRSAEEQVYCLAGPGGKPHIFSQLVLKPHEEREWKLSSDGTAVRLRSPQVSRPLALELEAASRFNTIRCRPEGFEVEVAPSTQNAASTRFVNPNPFPLQVSLESTQWSDDILTAARVTNWQEFRDLFASEVISPNEQVKVGSQVVLFTDLRGSTALYRGLGDAPAYALVRNHFSVLIEAISSQRGTVVKTIGDAVMAAFSTVEEGLAAIWQMHQHFGNIESNQAAAASGASQPPIRLALKSSLHVGPCLAVNANERLDYFGTTINLAARMVSCCQGGDLTVSNELYERAETSNFIRLHHLQAEASEVRFRGFDSSHRVWRIPMTPRAE